MAVRNSPISHLSCLVVRSLLYYWRTNFAVAMGIAIGVAIVVGALATGDSMRYSLKHFALSRLGETEFALTSGSRFFRSALASDVSETLGTKVIPAMYLSGIAIKEGGRKRVNDVKVLGVDETFWCLSPAMPPFHLAEKEAIVNQKLARRLSLQRGEEFLLRVAKLEPFPRDAPLASASGPSIVLRLCVKDIASDELMGRFSLQASQVEPCNVYVSLSSLSKTLDLPGLANMLLVAQSKGKQITLKNATEALHKRWRLSDAGLKLTRGEGMVELSSARIFLERSVEEAALAVGNGQGIFTYFVNEICAYGRSTPYSFVSAAPLTSGMKDDEIIVNEWLAEDLRVTGGEEIELKYYAIGSMRKIEERSRTFRVHSVTPLKGRAADAGLTPDFPGLADAQSCRNWQSSVPIALQKIRDKDEEYWQIYRGTPKAFVTLTAAREMWGNRFGALTAVRYAGGDVEEIESAILSRLSPASLGLYFSPVKEQGIRASVQSVDFGHLFLGLGFFIVIAAILLASLLFILSMEGRARETGTLLALGFHPKTVKRLFLAEGAALALAGGLIGIPCGLGYLYAVLYALSTVWGEAVGTSGLRVHLQLSTAVAGYCVAIFIALITLKLCVTKQILTPIHSLQADISKEPRNSLGSLAVTAICLGAAAFIIREVRGRGKEAAGAFFAAGALSLVGLMALCSAFLLCLTRHKSSEEISIYAIALRNCARRRGRSLTTIALLSCGIFLTIAIAANRHDPRKDTHSRDSGTGGFTFYGETALPVIYDLNSDMGMRAFALNPDEMRDVRFVHIRVAEGEDASCLNLNRAQNPTLLGVKASEFAMRGAFTSVISEENPWLSLTRGGDSHAVPAIADYNTIVWGLGKSVGDTISCVDESGRSFDVKLVAGLANSIFEGSILISEEEFIRRFPSVDGCRILLVEVPAARSAQVSKRLTEALEDLGLNLTETSERLAEFNAVENTYLNIFLVLGGLGIILGTAGLGIVLTRNALERKAELSILCAIGFTRSLLYRLLLLEHTLLLLGGLLCGSLAAWIAILPALASPGHIPWISLSITVAAITGSGFLTTWIAAKLALQGDLMSALRNE